MFFSPFRTTPPPAVHVLAKGVLLKGEIKAGQSALHIEGTVEGTIISEGLVAIATTGIVRGTILARQLIVTGKVEGILKIVECLEIRCDGCVEGEVELGSLVVDEGGMLQGNCTRWSAAKTNPLPTRFVANLPPLSPGPGRKLEAAGKGQPAPAAISTPALHGGFDQTAAFKGKPSYVKFCGD